MDRSRFLASLRSRLSSLPEDAVERSLAFYAEMLDDRVEDGMSEAEAVASMEPVDVIADRIVFETPLPVLLRERIRPRGGVNPLSVTLLVLGAPLWLPLLLSVIAVLAAVFVTVWSVVAALFATVIGLGAGGLTALVSSPLNFNMGTPYGLMVLGLGLVSLGVSIFAFFGTAAAAVGVARLTVVVSRWLRSLFISSVIRERNVST